MIAGASIPYWIWFHVLVAVLLIVDLAVLQRGKHSVRLRNAWAWTIFLVTLACGFALFFSKTQGKEPGLDFFSDYLIETSFSFCSCFPLWDSARRGSCAYCFGECWARL